LKFFVIYFILLLLFFFFPIHKYLHAQYSASKAHPSVRETYDWLLKRISSNFASIDASVEAALAARAKAKPKKSAAETQKRLEAIRARRKKEEEEEAAAKLAAGGGDGGGGEGNNAGGNGVRAPPTIAGVDSPQQQEQGQEAGGHASSLSPLPPIAPRGQSPVGGAASSDQHINQAALPGQTTI
jgi:hypothetical protein